MYIPTSFFSSQGACISASISNISGSGKITSGSFVSQSMSWSYFQIETSDFSSPATTFTCSLNITSGSTNRAKLLIVAAGGSGGNGDTPKSEYGCGGGGGGGVVYYDNFPLASGSYEIAVPGATDQTATSAVGLRGRNSYFKLPNNIIYSPFTSSFITAYGGGGGGVGALSVGPPATCNYSLGSAGGTSGGIGIYLQAACNAPTYSVNNPLTVYNGINFGPQGYPGGVVQNPVAEVSVGTGGGGAASSGSTFLSSTSIYGTNGGNGLDFNLTGTIIGVSPGGPGNSGETGGTPLGLWGNCTNSGSAWGRGGRGDADGVTSQDIYGLGGLVIIAWPKLC